jgi:hypothetical protein
MYEKFEIFYFSRRFCVFGYYARSFQVSGLMYTDKKENKIFLIYKEIQMGSGAKSYMRKSFLIYEEMWNFSPYMRRPLVIYDFAPYPS